MRRAVAIHPEHERAEEREEEQNPARRGSAAQREGSVGDVDRVFHARAEKSEQEFGH